MFRKKRDAATLAERYFTTRGEKYASALFDLLYRNLTGVVFYYVKDQTDAREIALSVFHRFLEVAATSLIMNPEAWLWRAGKFAALKFIRDKKTTIPYEERMGQSLVSNPEAWLNENPADAMEEKLLLALNDLEHQQQKCIRLFYLEGLTYGQISIDTGWTMMQVKSYIQNGKRNLRIALTQNDQSKTA